MRYEYEEFISSRSGDTIRIMDLKEYYSLLPDEQKSESHTGNDWPYTCTCPYCLEEAYKEDPTYHGRKYWKQKMYITKDFTTGKCFRCNAVYKSDHFDLHYQIPDMIKDIGPVSVSDLKFVMNDDRYSLELFKGLPEGVSEVMEDKLYNRNPYSIDFIDELKFKQVDDNHLLIPFEWRDEIIFTQVWQKGENPKYYNPRCTCKPIYVCGKIKKEAILVEGVFDAIACRTLYPDQTPIAVIGSTVTFAQELMLRSLFLDRIHIRMDDSIKSYKLYNKIKRHFEFTDIDVIESDGTDPEEELVNLINLRYGNN